MKSRHFERLYVIGESGKWDKSNPIPDFGMQGYRFHQKTWTPSDYCGPYRVGRTRDIRKRLAGHQSSSSVELKYLWFSDNLYSDFAAPAEMFLHQLLGNWKIRPSFYNHADPVQFWRKIISFDNMIQGCWHGVEP